MWRVSRFNMRTTVTGLFCFHGEFHNKKQCSRQLQCEVPCGIGNVINSSLFINSSLSSLSSTSHAVHGWGSHLQWGEGGGGRGGRGHFSLAAIYCTITWCFVPKGLRTTKESF